MAVALVTWALSSDSDCSVPRAAGEAPAHNPQHQTPLPHTFLLRCPTVCEVHPEQSLGQLSAGISSAGISHWGSSGGLWGCGVTNPAQAELLQSLPKLQPRLRVAQAVLWVPGASGVMEPCGCQPCHCTQTCASLCRASPRESPRQTHNCWDWAADTQTKHCSPLLLTAIHYYSLQMETV